MALTYKLESFIKKITAPVVIKYNDGVMEFTNGAEAYEHDFSERYSIKALYAKDNKIIIDIDITQSTVPYTYLGEAATL